MVPWRRLLAKLYALLAPKHVEEELAREIASHLALLADDFERDGMSPEEARLAARRAYGGVEQAKQAHRDERTLLWMEQLLQDLRYCLRSLSRGPGFTMTAVLTLALGIGACTAIFSVANSVLIRSLPYQEINRLVYVFAPIPRMQVPDETMMPSYADFLDLKKQSHTIATMTDFDQKVFTLSSGGSNSKVGAALVDESFFSTLKVIPVLGRTIDAADGLSGHDNVVVISYELWQSVFAQDKSVLTKSLRLDGKPYRIVGVMPAAFQYPHATDIPYLDPRIPSTQLWVPLVLSPAQRVNRDDSGGWVLARLGQGVSERRAQVELGTILARLDLLHDPFTRGSRILLKPLPQLAMGPARSIIWMLVGAVSLVLLIACGNAANLLLARASSRKHELGMRATLGASRSRMIRQMMTESLLLGLTAGCCGVFLGALLVHGLLRINPGDIPRLENASLDTRALFFCLGLSLLTSLLFGTLPALAASRLNLIELLKSGGSRGTMGAPNRLQEGLIILEISSVVILLAGAGLLLRSYANVISVDPGFVQSTVSLRVDLDSRFKPQQFGPLFRRLFERIGTLPGIENMGAIDGLPLTPFESLTIFAADGYANLPNQLVSVREASASYFSVMSTALLQGRFFRDNDTWDQEHSVVINKALADSYFAGLNPIGRRVSLHAPHPSWYTVVGVVANQRTKLEEDSKPTVYQPFVGEGSAYLVVRSQLPPQAVAAMVGGAMHAVEPDLVASNFNTMGEILTGATAQRRFQTITLAAFAAIAVLLGLVGIYGLLTYMVKLRTPEIGVRIALGASRRGTLAMILRQGLQLAGIGLVIGLAGALVVTRILASSLYGVSRYDPFTISAVLALLLLVTVAASLIPALRAATVDPMRVLRYD